MKRRSLLLALPAALAATTLAACSSGNDSGSGSGAGSDSGSGSDGGGSDAAVALVASTNVWGDIASQVGGDLVEVTSLITDPEADPHEYEASTRNQLALKKARIVLENGGGYDDFVARMLSSAGNSSATVLDAVTISGYKAEKGEELNEHVWYDFPTVRKVIDELVTALSAAHPEGKADFEANGTKLASAIEDLEDREKDLSSSAKGKGVAITEPVPLYMLEAVGLTNRTPKEFSEAIEEGDDVSASVLKETLDLFADHEVDLLAYNEQTAGPQTEQVKKAAEDADVPVVGVTETLPDGKDYVAWMSSNLDALEDALGK
ncbi:metal ABC transporter solute-binding protein, Zn/Mn family [Brachybacterium sp. ACRRE]|uniref:metal ABC transporter solute-binding protein, Zn/Mn family n=1 Tax=Brachybacterium sp. ACRRE TaxID=2918184 RepID=UPI001EF3B41C|nr:zinc ABC transporter substrate-binding protein [Brachybacterium sp. ACRRE]MCG7310266.1 zinc ABC transporter substrate-binding protein [Brachybacterium sp. ACRRE]